MKITKTAVKAGCCGKCDHKKSALTHIQAAMDELALVENDPVCVDSIANLSVVLVDLSPMICEDDDYSDASSMGTFTNEGMVEQEL